MRKGDPGQPGVIIASNFTPVVRQHYAIGIPEPGYYREIFNSDAKYYGGSDVGNHPGLESREVPAVGRPYSLMATLPPLATVIFRREG